MSTFEDMEHTTPAIVRITLTEDALQRTFAVNPCDSVDTDYNRPHDHECDHPKQIDGTCEWCCAHEWRDHGPAKLRCAACLLVQDRET